MPAVLRQIKTTKHASFIYTEKKMGSVRRGRGVYELNITDENKTDPLLISFMLFSDMLWTFNSFKEMFYTESLCGESQRMFQIRLMVGFTCEAQKLSLIHISEPTRRTPISYAVFCLKTKK